MPIISGSNLAVFISLLSSKISEMKRELIESPVEEDELSDEQLADHYELQECIEQYENILSNVRAEYEAGLVDGINLPSYDELTKTLDS